MVRTRRQIAAVAAAQRGELLTSAFEHSAVRDYIGKDRYLQLAVSKALARAYSSRFGPLTTKSLTNIAAEQGELTLVDWARSVGCNWDPSVFLSAIKGGRTQTLQHLLDNDCPVPEGEEACTCAAATEGGLEALMWLRERDFAWGEAICTRAAARGDLPLLLWARVHGCPSNLREIFAEAARNGKIHILEWCEEVGIPFNQVACIMLGADSLRTLQWLRARNCAWNESFISAAIVGGHCHVFQWAKSNGCPYAVNSSGVAGVSLLHISILKGFADIAKILLTDGADHGQTLNGQTPLHMAVLHGRVDIALALMKAGACVNARDGKPRTALLFACECGDLDMVKALLTRGADTELRDIDGYFPLIAAIVSHHVEIVRALLEAGASPHSTDRYGRSALQFVTQAGTTKVAQLLAGWRGTSTR